MKAILAINNQGYIGLKDGLPWRCTEDLKHFKKLTVGCKLLVGYNTAKTLPNLPGREIVIFDRDNQNIDVSDIDWCIGGKKTYEFFLDKFTELHISHINDNTIGDVMGPDLVNLNSECVIVNYYFEKN